MIHLVDEQKIGPVNLVDPEQGIHQGFLRIKGGCVDKVEITGEEDPERPYVLPGFVDPHLHGAVGVDFMSASEEDLERLEIFLRSKGVAGCLLTTVSASYDRILKALNMLNGYIRHHPGSIFKGVHLEGPYINPEKRGAHDPRYIKELNVEELREVLSHPLVRLVTIAPELEGFEEVVNIAKEHEVLLSIGHTTASFDVIKKAVEMGVKRFTHLCNAMPLLHHRDVGPLGGAFLLEDTVAEIIVDGVHLSPEMVKLIYRLMDSRIELVTDAMAATGLNDGLYSLGSLEVRVKNGVARLHDGTIAGSTLTMDMAVVNYHAFTGAGHLEVMKVSSSNAAHELKLRNLGRICEGAPLPLIEVGPRFEYLKVIE
ncbi:MAG: N-acetylglucosamine-6-phosphate deacetylase [Thermotogota bacterium]|nr:N-acetylglucosamine-6-phosphate deacetylase [Thermotogota bacterium]